MDTHHPTYIPVSHPRASKDLFSPSRRADGTFVFYLLVEDGHVAMIALEDLDFFAKTSGRGLEVASDMVS
ncbi:hypothetical protein BJV78DRAFT_1191559 [Lactifluus subvellereus]|nr:hypothetical protein BJV78DRAFT_1191559 [Lactifluus subvellereus]